MKADKLYLGNIVTMDDYKPTAQALLVKDGLIQYVGSEAIARSICDENTEVIDFGSNTIYPGFLEAHCHPLGAGQMLDTEAFVDVSAGNSLEEYVAIVADFMKAHPGKRSYKGHGFMERDVKPTAVMLDAICPDVPVILTSTDGHSMWLNTKALEFFHLDQEAAQAYGTDLVRVDENGEPTGYISENPVFDIRKKTTLDPEDGKRFLMNAQRFFFSHGYTAVYDAGVELVDKSCPGLYKAVVADGSLKLRTYAGSLVDENCADIPAAVEKIAAMQKDNSEFYKVIGVKTFSDGVIEAHTGYLLEDYNDQPGYKGTARLTDHEKLVEVYTAAARLGLSVHVHTVGDAAIHCNLDAIEEAAAVTGKMDQRFALAHLQLVKKEDIQRFADLNVVAVVASLWTPKHKDYFPQELAYVGPERAESAYPIQSFVDAGAVTAFHTDFPVSRSVSIPKAVFTAVKRRNPEDSDEAVRASNEFITRYQALLSMTRNVAYMWHEENRMGSLAVGKLANMVVFDKNFLTDSLEDVAEARLISTIVDGEEVFKG